MTTLKVRDKEYSIKFGFNCFCDTDLLDKVNNISELFASNNVETDAEVNQMGKVKDLFLIVRELLFVGFKKYNPVDDVTDIGNILDDYMEEVVDGESRGLLELFGILAEELMNEGFLSDLMRKLTEQMSTEMKPQDHKKKSK